MKIYIDESGNTGGVLLSKKDKQSVNYGDQELISLGAVVTLNEEDENELIRKYMIFKNKFSHLQDSNHEIKGSKLMIKSSNDALEYFYKNILDTEHFFINAYDKNFYLATIFFHQLFLPLLSSKENLYSTYSVLYEMANDTYKNHEFIIKFLEYSSTPNEDNFKKCILELGIYYASDSSFKRQEEKLSLLKDILSDDDLTIESTPTLAVGEYFNNHYGNLINMAGTGELLNFIHENHSSIDKSKTKIFLDPNDGITTEIVKELKKYDVQAVDNDSSKKLILLQLVDNFTTIFNKSLIRMYEILNAPRSTYFLQANEWDAHNYTKIRFLSGFRHAKLTIPMYYYTGTSAMCELYSNDQLSRDIKSFDKICSHYFNEHESLLKEATDKIEKGMRNSLYYD